MVMFSLVCFYCHINNSNYTYAYVCRCVITVFLNPMLNYLMENIHVLFLQATRDMHKSGLVLSAPSSQFKGNSCIELCKFILVETSLYIRYNCILYGYVFEEWH